ncbi:MAG: hypothetical protein RIQ93_2444, partial [Verrucomicrobiota bacterium]
MPQPSPRDRFLDLLRAALRDGTMEKLTLGKYRGRDASLENLYVRPVTLKSGHHLGFLWRHATRDVTKNHPPEAAVVELEALIGASFLDAHLFTTGQSAQLECQPDGVARLRIKQASANSGPEAPPVPLSLAHDRPKSHLISADAPWLKALGVTNPRGQPREGMADKFRQIQKFAELFSHLLDDSGLAREVAERKRPPLQVVDMGSGKGYLTFALAAVLGERAIVRGIELRPELVDLCQRVARENRLTARLSFSAGSIADSHVDGCDALIALHACDTATDDALARGVACAARLLVVAPCCQKELRSQLTAAPVLAGALRHGIFQERQAEFVTDALRAQLLEWAGYRTRVFEFISTEHTARNLMIAGIRSGAGGDAAAAEQIREFAAFYGIRHHRLATLLKFPLVETA